MVKYELNCQKTPTFGGVEFGCFKSALSAGKARIEKFNDPAVCYFIAAKTQRKLQKPYHVS